jgi:hypothetical protein
VGHCSRTSSSHGRASSAADAEKTPIQHVQSLSVASKGMSCNALLPLLLLLLPLRALVTLQAPCTAHMEPSSTG